MPKARKFIKRDFDTQVVEISRVTRVVAGGKRMRFRALIVAGDRKGKVGIGLKKGADVAEAVGKATQQARSSFIKVPIKEGTILHQIQVKYKAAQVLLKPAKQGTGIIAGGPVRAVIDLVGIKNISSKMLGSANKVSNVRATFEALKRLGGTKVTSKTTEASQKPFTSMKKKNSSEPGKETA